MIIGIDEVGRGCWAGPLVAAAVGFDGDVNIAELTDSKLLTAQKRIKLVVEIQATTEHIGIGWVWPREINELGLTESIRLAMQRAINEITEIAERVIIDGNFNFLPHIDGTEAIVKADGSVASVSAASIIAKVARDTYMIKIAKKYPEYAFEKHVGYGTKLHIKALAKYGVLPLHRVNYKPIKKFLASSA